MAYVRMRGIPGLVYVPDAAPFSPKKHPCRDCFACQWCSDERCALCLRGKVILGTQGRGRTHRRRRGGGCPRRCATT